MTGIECSWEYGNSGVISGISEAGRWSQGGGCDPRIDKDSHWVSDKNILGIVEMGASFTHQEKMARPCQLPHGYHIVITWGRSGTECSTFKLDMDLHYRILNSPDHSA